jgi:predicted metalloendopeptidase
VLSAWREKGDAMAFRTGDRQQRLTDTLLLLHSKGESITPASAGLFTSIEQLLTGFYVAYTGIEALFDSSVQGDYYQDPNLMRLFITQSGLGLPNPDYYDDGKVQKVYIEVIRSAMTSVYGELEKSHALGGKKKPSLDFNAKEVFAFEKKLAASFWDKWVNTIYAFHVEYEID